jgi:hypothetical protein
MASALAIGGAVKIMGARATGTYATQPFVA